MKKGFLFTLAAALAMCFVGCNPENTTPDNGGGDNNSYSQLIVGTWLIDTMIVNGEEMTPENIQLSFYAGGTGLLNDNGETQNNEFGWSINGQDITITPRSDTEEIFHIELLTSTECTFTGNTIPGTDMTASVRVHMTKVGGGNPDPGPGPGPGPNPEGFPANTMWEFHYDTTMAVEGITVQMNMTYSLDFINATNCDLGMNYVVSYMSIPMADTSMVFPMTYTYNSTSDEGIFTIADPESSESDTLPFVYNENDNTIIIDVPEEYFQGDDDDEGPDMPVPTHWVFQRVR